MCYTIIINKVKYWIRSLWLCDPFRFKIKRGLGYNWHTKEFLFIKNKAKSKRGRQRHYNTSTGYVWMGYLDTVIKSQPLTTLT